MNRKFPARTDKEASINTLFHNALHLHHSGQLDGAALLYRQALSLKKNQFETLHMLGVLEGQRSNLPEGVRLIKEALKINPKSADAHLNLGRLQGELEYLDDAEKSFRKALAIGPESALAYCNLSAVLDRLQRPKDALDAAERALTIAPSDLRAHFNKANALYSLRRYGEAEVIYRELLAASPKNPDAWLRLAKTCSRLYKTEEALGCFEKTEALSPTLRGLWYALGELFSSRLGYVEALTAFDQELKHHPESGSAWRSRGDTLRDMKRFRESIASYENALKFDRVDRKQIAVASRVWSKMGIFDWQSIETEFAYLLKQVRRGEPLMDPFRAIQLDTSSEDQFRFTREVMQKEILDVVPRSAISTQKHDRIKIAYVSSDFGDHPVSQLLVGALEQHDKSKFEIVAWSLMQHQSQLKERISKGVEHFIDGSAMSDMHAAETMRQMGISIAIDLNGYSLGRRPMIFASRAAPVQVNFLGYPGTSALNFMDYIIADRTVIPEMNEKFYSEQVALMPHSFMPADSMREIAALSVTRRDAGLPGDSPVFCSFNDAYKIHPTLFDVWMRILNQVGGSVLWLRDPPETGSENLRREAEKRGVSGDRLVFTKHVESHAAHLARYKLADLFLDTLPYNAHATANEALWAGLPVLTCPGKAFAGRVAASLLNAVGLPELVTASLADYEALAVKLARDPVALNSIKDKLTANRLTKPLFDTARYTRHLEQAYTAMWDRALRNEPPASFKVEAG